AFGGAVRRPREAEDAAWSTGPTHRCVQAPILARNDASLALLPGAVPTVDPTPYAMRERCPTRRAWHRESQRGSLAWATTSDDGSAGGGRNAGAGRSADDGSDARH